jgi:hypothetical protein
MLQNIEKSHKPNQGQTRSICFVLPRENPRQTSSNMTTPVNSIEKINEVHPSDAPHIYSFHTGSY